MKKGISIMLIMTLLLMASMPVFAESKDSTGLEQAILAVKKVITIPNDYKEFDYYMNENSEEGANEAYWNLSWRKTDSSDSIHVQVSKDNHILRYNKYNDIQKEGIGRVTREKAVQIADIFLEKARPELAKKMKLQNSNDANTQSHNLNYMLYENDIPVDFMQAYFEIDKFTGEVTSFNGSGLEQLKLTGKDQIISKETAKKAYLENLGIQLRYYSNFDYNKKTLTIFPAYGITNQNKVVDATTGKLVNIYYDYRYNSLNNVTEDKEAAGGKSELTKEELSEIEKVSALISKEKAEELCRTMTPGLTSSMRLTNTNLYKDYINKDQYIWNLGFDGASISLDGKTGTIISFYVYKDQDLKNKNIISEDNAKNTAETFIKKIEAEKFAQTQLSQNDFYQPKPYISSEQTTDYSFQYERIVNGIPFTDNSISITIDALNGKIIQYNCRWYDSVKFPSVENAMSREKAFGLYDKNNTFGLKYVKTDKDKVSLVYGFQEDVNYLMNPKTGAKLNWDGNPYRESKIPQYSDIKGHWCENTIVELLENGYYIEGEQFYPNKKMTQLQFFRFLYAPVQAYYTDEELYKMLENSRIIINGKEKAPNKELTRQDVAKFVVRYLGQAKSAEHPEIFINPFKDSVNKEYKGYAAICYGLGIMKGDKKGRFNGNNMVSHAEAAVVIHQVLKNK